MEAQKVGIREFRAGIAEYVASATPVAITRHGETVGYFIPIRRHAAGDAEINALKEAGALLDRLLAEKGVTEDEIVADFKDARKRGAGKQRK
ncbi:MAG: hypothetical protein KGZ83_22465 [Sulfuricella sp.]|nr:hypothetical protein [Sulfuricella sp.]